MFDRAGKELWVWTELLAFDNTRRDFGVKAYLDEAQKIPTGISFLTGYDFALKYAGMDRERVLPPGVCSRSAHETNGRRERQKWTNYQVRGLIAELHKYGIKAVFNIFPCYLRDHFGREFLTDANPEKRSALIAPMNDGRLMGDFMLEKIAETITGYGFDGWQAADDIAAPWSSVIYPTDNLIRLFAEENRSLGLPAFLLENADRDDLKRRKKLQYLQQFRWREWNDYLLAAWKRFWVKAVATIHGLGKILLVNSPNTKSVFGALQYLNVDYRQLAELGVDYLIAETCTTSCGLVWHNRSLLHEFSAMMSEMTASMPGVKILIMPAVRDRVEGFDMFEHALSRLERDIHILNSQGILRDGELKRCADGFMFCLGDCIDAWEWKRFHEIYGQSVSFDAVRNGEMIWLLDPKAFDALHEDHHLYGTWSPAAQITELKNRRSIDISTIAAVSELDNITQPMIVPNFHLLGRKLQKRILAKKLPLVLTGNFRPDGLPAGAEAVRWKLNPDFVWHCVFLNWPGQMAGRIVETLPERTLEPFHEAKPFSLYRDMYPHLDMPENFWQAAADRIRELLGPLPLENESEGMQLFRQYAADGTERRIQVSHRDYYIVGKCRMDGFADPEITAAGTWPKMPLCVKNGLLAHTGVREIPIRIPPHGMVAVDVKEKKTRKRGKRSK